jgi:hypothetical protein
MFLKVGSVRCNAWYQQKRQHYSNVGSNQRKKTKKGIPGFSPKLPFFGKFSLSKPSVAESSRFCYFQVSQDAEPTFSNPQKQLQTRSSTVEQQILQSPKKLSYFSRAAN